MTLIKTSVLSLIATIFKVSFGLVVNKLLAVYGGASAIALVGQFQNVQAALVGIATAGFGQGLTKYLAEFKQDVLKCQSVFATASKLVAVFLLPLSVVIFLFSDHLSSLLFNTNEYGIWLKGLSVSLVPGALGMLFLATLNGLGEVRSLTLVGVLSSCFGMAAVVFLVPMLGISGVIIGLLLMPFLVLVLAVWYLHNTHFFSWTWLQESINHKDTKRLSKFALMALVTAISIPVSHIMIRTYLGDSISPDAAGLWTGLWRVSEAYLLVITMTLSVYYLPKLSSLTGKKELIDEMKHGYKIIMPLAIVSAVSIFLLRDWIILFLFTDSLLEMRGLFLWQFIGDVIKIGCFLMGFVLLAKGLVTMYIIKEIVISVLFVLFTYTFVDEFGLVGVTYAYVATYSVNFLLLLMIMRHYFQNIIGNKVELT